MGAAPVALLAATALHLGFQLTVTVLVYPALTEVRSGDWEEAHDRHSRRIVPLVGLTYLLLLVASVVALAVGPLTPWLLVAGAGELVAVGTTAAAAAPLHGRLGRGHDGALLARLRRVDRVRLAGGVVAVVGAGAWWLTSP